MGLSVCVCWFFGLNLIANKFTSIAVTTTSTTTTTTTTTKTTTTTEAPPSVGRRAPFGNARNRPKTNRSKPTIETKQPEEEKEITSSESSVTKPKSKNFPKHNDLHNVDLGCSLIPQLINCLYCLQIVFHGHHSEHDHDQLNLLPLPIPKKKALLAKRLN